jgi:hypothetical protein
LRTKLGKSHLRRRKSSRVRAQLAKMQKVSGKGMQKRVRKLAPYLKEK